VGGSGNAKTPSGVLKILAAPEIEPQIRSFAERIVHNIGPFGTLKMPEISVAGDDAAFRSICGRDVDIVGVTRRITADEAQWCGRPALVEIPLGYQAVVILRNRLSGAPNLTSRDLFLALSATVPDSSSGRVLPNPYGAWSQIDPGFGYDAIQVIGPPLRSSVWRGFVATIMTTGCRKIAAIAETESPICGLGATYMMVREGGSYYEEVDYGSRSTPSTSIPVRLSGNPAVIGIVGYLTYEALSKTAPEMQIETMGGVVLGGTIDGIAPSRDALAAGTYPGSRPLYMYVSRAHIQSMRDQLEYFVRTFSFPDSMSNDPSLVPLLREVDKAARSQALGRLSSGN
jgi:phosphate transport system substrate-binding protein